MPEAEAQAKKAKHRSSQLKYRREMALNGGASRMSSPIVVAYRTLKGGCRNDQLTPAWPAMTGHLAGSW